jgi:ABC-type phosphate transport system substrate-binding protein
MMRYLIATLPILLLISAQAWADIVVVVHPQSELKNLTKQQVIDIYMGRLQISADGGKIVPYDQPQDSEIRAAFYQNLTGKPVASVNAYWARLLFTGRASPPRQPSDSMSIVDIVAESLYAIGYIDEKDLDGRVSIVFKAMNNE